MNQTILKSQLLFFFVFLASFSSAQDYHITNFETQIEVTKEGHLEIEEIIDVNFNKKRRGIIRSFENRYETNNKIVKFDIQDIALKNHKFKISKSKNDISIRIGDPKKYILGEERYVITYTVKNGILPFPDHQELHYDITGHKWDTSIDKMSFTIRLPKGITLSPTDLKVTGGPKNKTLDIVEIRQVDPQTITGKTKQRLEKNNGVTTAIKFPARYLAVANNEIEYYEDADAKNQDVNPKSYKPWYLAVPLAIFSLFFSFWSRMRRNDFFQDNDVTRPYPPEGLTSAHVGAFIDQTSNYRDIVSLLPYWASEGYIELKQIEDEIYLYRIKNIPPDFPEYEHIIFDKLFLDKDVSKLSDLENKFHPHLTKAKSMLHKEIGNQGYYKDEYIAYFKSWRLIIFPVIMIVIGLISIIQFKLLFLGIGCFIASFAGLILPLFKVPLTEKGSRLHAEAIAFERFLKDPDPKRIENLMADDPSYFDKVLPFAVAFGIDKNFLQSMEPVMHHAPAWYHSDQANISFSTFSEGFRPEKIQSAFSSTPHTSSSGSGGGGFSSGSGMGGGGGSSW